MYVHQHQLEHLLKPFHYTDPEFFQHEIKTLFEPTWHLAGCRSEIPRQGDFLTFELFDRPIILRNCGDRFQAYENICAHRHTLLTSKPCGRMEKLRCQYHGWEYDDAGRTGKIPDAKCFRPFDRENAHLNLIRTESVGGIIFVTFNNDAPPIRTHLDDVSELYEESFNDDFRLVWRWNKRIATNWKVPVENTVEMYHLPCLHKKSFGTYPKEETCTHVLTERATTLHTLDYFPLLSKIQSWAIRRLGRTPTLKYWHHVIHPNLVFIGMDSFRLTEQFVPISPDETEQRVWLYAVQGKRWNPLALYIQFLMRFFVRSTTRKILTEDLPIFPAVQRGMRTSSHPGVIGSLEERIHVFQKWVLDETTARNEWMPRHDRRITLPVE